MEKSTTTIIHTDLGQFYCFNNDLITSHLIDFGAHTRNELMMILDHVSKNDVVLDIGSHIGTYGIPIGRKLATGSGQVYCLEANVATFELLTKNIEHNHLSHVIHPTNLIISHDDSLQYDIVETPQNTGANYYKEVRNSSILTDVSTLKNYLDNSGIAHIDLIKMDVEGMEYHILHSIKEKLKECRPILYIEVSASQLARYDSSPSHIEEFLRSLDYEFYMNTYKRNSSEDYYAKSKILNLNVRPFFDLLAIPQ